MVGKVTFAVPLMVKFVVARWEMMEVPLAVKLPPEIAMLVALKFPE